VVKLVFAKQLRTARKPDAHHIVVGWQKAPLRIEAPRDGFALRGLRARFVGRGILVSGTSGVLGFRGAPRQNHRQSQ
jgi:hypothetical protein